MSFLLLKNDHVFVFICVCVVFDDELLKIIHFATVNQMRVYFSYDLKEC